MPNSINKLIIAHTNYWVGGSASKLIINLQSWLAATVEYSPWQVLLVNHTT